MPGSSADGLQELPNPRAQLRSPQPASRAGERGGHRLVCDSFQRPCPEIDVAGGRAGQKLGVEATQVRFATRYGVTAGLLLWRTGGSEIGSVI